MRIVHLADTHLGFKQYANRLDPTRNLNQRECDVYDAWHRAIDIAVEREVDAVVHAGDLFDSPRPSHRAVAEALDGLGRLREAGIPAIAIAGNHSTPRIRSGGSVFEVLQRFGLLAAWDAPETFIVGGVAFHAVPHEADSAQLQADIEALQRDPGADANVLIAHAGLEAVRASYGEVNEITISPEVLAQAPFDYIALGHLHRFQAPQRNALYPGSLERLDFNDLEGDKAVLEIDLSVPAGSPGFVIRHPLATRALLDLDVDCTGLDQREVLDAVEARIDGLALEGAVVRLRCAGLQRDVFGALDRGRIDELFAGCLFHHLQPGPHGLVVTGGDDAPELVFSDWARDRVPAGLDAERVIGIAKRFLEDAAVAEAEEAAA